MYMLYIYIKSIERGVTTLNIVLTNQSNRPIYQQIADQIRESILKGELYEGDLLPSIRTLAKDLHISVITTKRAYDELEKEGFIISSVGKGSYVAPKNIEMLRELNLKQLESLLQQVVQLAGECNLTVNDLTEMLTIFANGGLTKNDDNA